MAKVTSINSSSSFMTFLVWSLLVAVVLADLWDNQLLGVNATWPTGAKLMEQDCCDGNMSDPSSMTPFRAGPPIIHIKVNHDSVYPENYIQATKESLLSSKYLVLVTLYNQTQISSPTTQYNNVELIWIQGNMTASTTSGNVLDNNTFAILSNDTEPLLPYDADFNVSQVVSNLLFSETTWQLSVGVYQQTPELDKYLATTLAAYDGISKFSMANIVAYMFENLYWGTENPSKFWNATAISPWGRVYADVPGIYDSAISAISTGTGASPTGASTGTASTSSSQSTATTSKAASNDAASVYTVYRGTGTGFILFCTWMTSALMLDLFV